MEGGIRKQGFVPSCKLDGEVKRHTNERYMPIKDISINKKADRTNQL